MSLVRGVVLATTSSYLKVVCRAATGLVTFRLLRSGLGDADFGFWTVLWSTFGFMMLVDFGLGYTVARVVARAQGDPSREARSAVGQAVATVFWASVAVTAAVGVGLAIGGDAILGWLFSHGGVASPEHRRELAAVAVVFAAGMLLSYPLGLFRAVLWAQHRVHLANLLETAAVLAQAALVCVGYRAGWGLMGFMIASVATTVGPVAIIAALAMRDPDLRPHPGRFSRTRLVELAGFGSYAYAISLCNQVSSRADPLLVGRLISLPAVAWYAPAMKLADTYGMLTQQMQSILGPTSARLDAGGGDAAARGEALRRLVLVSQRWTILIAASLIVPLVLDIDGALLVLNGKAALPAESVTAAWVLLAATAVAVVGSSALREVLMMTGHHRAMLGFSVCEAVGKVAVSAWLLVRWRSITAAAVGSLVPSLAVSLVLIPWCARRAFAVRARDALAAGARGLAGAGGAIAVAGAWALWRPVPQPTWNFLIGCAVTSVGMLPGWWFVGMTAGERERVRGWSRRLRARGA